MKVTAEKNPLVSVILGVYNQEKYVRKAIESILEQSYQNIEIIILNNGSTDNSAMIINEYSTNPRIKILSYIQNMSIGITMNSAIDMTSGEYVCCIAGDDYYLPTYIETHESALSALPNEYGVVYSPYLVHNEVTGAIFPYDAFNKSGDIFDALLKAQLTGFISAFTPFVRRAVFNEFKYDETIFCEGESIFIRIASKYKFNYVDSVLYVATDHNLNQGKNYKENSEQFLACSRKHVNLFPEKKRLINKIIAFMFIRNAWIAIRIMGDKAWARKCIKIAIEYKFSSLFHYRLIATLILLPFSNSLIGKIFFFRKNKGRLVVHIEKDYSGRAKLEVDSSINE